MSSENGDLHALHGCSLHLIVANAPAMSAGDFQSPGLSLESVQSGIPTALFAAFDTTSAVTLRRLRFIRSWIGVTRDSARAGYNSACSGTWTFPVAARPHVDSS